jgi:hypothetical protein
MHQPKSEEPPGTNGESQRIVVDAPFHGCDELHGSSPAGKPDPAFQTRSRLPFAAPD